MNRTNQGIVTGLVTGVAVWAITLPMLAIYGTSTGPEQDHYRVTDLGSHIEMCQSWVTEIERPACMDAAYSTWGD